MSQQHDLGIRRFGSINWIGLFTLAEREIRRFSSIWSQTVLAPLVTAGLFLVIFTIAIGPQRGAVMGVPFMDFIAPGILMMTVIQNAFANTSFSLLSAKIQGNIIDTMMPPLSPFEMLLGYLAGGVARGLLVAVTIGVGVLVVLRVVPHAPLVTLMFVLLGSAFMAALGILTGIFARRFDQMAAITNFIITPFAFLSGSFYSVQSLPPVLYALTYVNPMFHMIDGVRYGVLGVSDSSPVLGAVVCIIATVGLCYVTWRLLISGYRLKP
ncbi:MAG: ABC transporter permease [Rhodobacteraceae bacterium]|nr:ABC transporter permease [Paracoccaceae bacterium]